jgi:hypothetical protein
MLGALAGCWVAVGGHGGLRITVAANDLDPTAITVAQIPDPLVGILGPEPDDPQDRASS